MQRRHRFDVLVNNAGLYPSPPTTELADVDLNAMLAVNTVAPASPSP